MTYIPKSLRNPIPEQIRDLAELDKIFTKWKIIPYFGTTENPSHYWLNVLKNICILSPTHNICKENVQNYAFGGIEFFENRIGIDRRRILEVTKELHSEFTDTGNQYLRIRAVKVNEEWRVSLNSLDVRNFAYLQTKPFERPIGIYTEKFSEDYWRIKEPEVIAVTKFGGELEVTENKEVFETVIHMKRPGAFYGKPKILHILDDLCVDYFVRNMTNKISATEIISKYIVLTQNPPPEILNEGEDEQEEENEVATALRQLTTTEGGQPHSLGYINYQHNVNKPEMLELNLNREPKWNESSLRTAQKAIYGINDWSPILSGEEPPPSSLGSSMLPMLFIQKNLTNIQPTQELYQDFWLKAFEWINLVTGVDLGQIEFTKMIDQAVNALKELNAPQG